MNLVQGPSDRITNDPFYAEKPLQDDGNNTPGKVRPLTPPNVRQSDGGLTAPAR